MSRKIGKVFLSCLIISMLVLGTGLSALAAESTDMLALGGDADSDPLLIEIYDNGRIGLYFWQFEAGDPDNDLIWQNQYYNWEEDGVIYNCWGTNIFFDVGQESKYYTTDYYKEWFYSTGIDVGNGTLVRNGNTISGTWLLEEGDITFEQLVTYNPGSYMYEKELRLSNNTTDVEYTNLKLIHGGDTFFGGDDAASSYWNETLNMIFLRNESMEAYGIMAFAGTFDSPADKYFAGDYNQGGNHAIAGDLPNTADPNYIDAGYQLQWNQEVLAPGETWSIRSYELITEPNALQIIAPVDQLADPCEVLEYTFSIFNFSEDERTVDLSTSSANSWLTEIDGEAQITLAGNGGSAQITVLVTVPCDTSSNDSDIITLTATDNADETISVAGSVRATVRQQPPRIITVTPEAEEIMQGTASLLIDVTTIDLAEGEKVFIDLLDPDENPLDPAVSAEGMVDAEGMVTIDLSLPADLAIGDYLIMASLAENADSMSTPLSVIAPPVIVLPEIIGVTPENEEITQGETSLKVTIETENTEESAVLLVAVLDEDGNPLDPAISASGVVDASGKAVITLTLPEDMPLGMYNLLVSLADAEDDTSAWFEVIAALEPIPQTGAESSAMSYISGVFLLLIAGTALTIRKKLSRKS